MRRVLAIAAALGCVILASTAFASGEGDDGSYLVRAYFDNGSFTVSGQDVRIGGANVGVIEDVDVSLPGEKVSNEPGQEVRPGTALVVLKIDDPGYQDFRADASCILRPQSLIGERFVDCSTTEQRADSSEAPPELEVIPDGQPGAGQRLLPLENNGRTVDIDLVNNIYREPYKDRFRLILNELGAGFATRGDELAEIIERADPALREGNKVLEKLADQRKTLAKLTKDSDTILKPFSKARGDLTGFIKNAAVPAGVTAERTAELELALTKLPTFLRELRSTMGRFDEFTTAAVPVLDDLGVAAPDITRATKALDPFSKTSTAALVSLGNAGEKAGPLFTEANPIVKRATRLAKTGQGPTKNLDDFLLATKDTGGFEELMKLIYNTNASLNGFDQFGTYLRTYLLPDNCVDYLAKGTIDCNGTFKEVSFSAPLRSKRRGSSRETELGKAIGDAVGPLTPEQGQTPAADSGEDTAGESPEVPEADGQTTTPEPASPAPDSGDSAPSAPAASAQRTTKHHQRRSRASRSTTDRGVAALYRYLLKP